MPAPPLHDPAQVLRRVFGFASFRGLQAQVIEHLMAGGDALVLMPTGGGKSLCYQIPALCRPGLGVVVSPLISLMRDQVEALRQLGVRAAALNSSLGPAEAAQVERAMAAGQLDLVYVAPERLLTERCLSLLGRCHLALFAIDEAHCVSQWGHDFRPEYLQLAALPERWPQVPRVALTATADEPTRRDILARLDLARGRMFVAGFDRPNIRYRVGLKENPRAQLLRFVRGEHPGQAGIVYCISRERVEGLAAWLSDNGVPALPYHAGLDKDLRSRHQDRFTGEEGLVMVATIAFGMGIDKPDVRFVAHLDLPKSLEAYYQETGRAGRDGLPADAWMIYGLQDLVKQRHFIENSQAPDQQKRIEHGKLESLLGFCETTRCRRQVLLEYFGDSCPPCGNCDTCLEPVETFDGTVAAQKAMSCVYRTGERFGAGHVIDVLLGKAGEKALALGHDRLSTFGIGEEFSRPQWRSIFRQLVALGLLDVDAAGHGGLRLGQRATEVLRQGQRVELRQEALQQPEHQAKGRRDRKERARGRTIGLEDPTQEEMFAALRAYRLELARAQGVPPYVIFHDTTLLEMTRRRPRSLEEMAQVPGVGQHKLERYGARFLALILKQA